MASEKGQEALRLVRNIAKVGRVSSVNASEGTVRVIFEDRDNSISNDLPLLEIASTPNVNDQVLCLFLGNGIEDGYCLGGFYSNENPPPEVTP